MQRRSHVSREQAVTRDDRLFRHGGPAGQAETRGHLALVELRTLGEPRLLRMLGDHPVEGLDVLKGPAHQQWVGHAPAVVGEHADPRDRIRHRAELGQPDAGQPGRDRTHRLDIAVPRGPAETPDLFDYPGGIGDGIGIGHGVHGGVAAEGGRRGPGLNRFRILTTRLTQVRMQVDEAGQGDEAVGIEHPGTRVVQPGLDGHDGSAAEQDVSDPRPPLAAVPATVTPLISHLPGPRAPGQSLLSMARSATGLHHGAVGRHWVTAGNSVPPEASTRPPSGW